MKIYIAGPMTGLPQYNFVNFTKAKFMWQKLGHEVQTPFDANNRVWQKHFGKNFDPYHAICDYGNKVMLDCWKEDINVLLWADVIALLPEWEKSRGARIEVQTALLFNKYIHNAITLERVKIKVSLTFNTE